MWLAVLYPREDKLKFMVSSYCHNAVITLNNFSSQAIKFSCSRPYSLYHFIYL